MNAAEFAIIYFSIGCAVAAHFYFKSSRQTRSFLKTKFWTVSACILWPVCLVRNLVGINNLGALKSVFASSLSLDSKTSVKIAFKQKEIESLLISADNPVKLFELRDTVARYSGLSTALSEPIAATRLHLLEISGDPISDTQLSCLYRRNRQRLIRHRNEARADFIKSIALLMKVAENPEKAGVAAVDFVKLLKDDEAVQKTEAIIQGLKQNDQSIPVKQMENQTWIPQEQ